MFLWCEQEGSGSCVIFIVKRLQMRCEAEAMVMDRHLCSVSTHTVAQWVAERNGLNPSTANWMCPPWTSVWRYRTLISFIAKVVQVSPALSYSLKHTDAHAFYTQQG